MKKIVLDGTWIDNAEHYLRERLIPGNYDFEERIINQLQGISCALLAIAERLPLDTLEENRREYKLGNSEP